MIKIKRVIILDISQTYTQIYDEIYFAENEHENYVNVIKSYNTQPDKYVCVAVTY